MPTDTPMTGARLSYYLFPHQDDEFATLQCMRNELAEGHSVKVIYLTSGNYNNVDPEVRNRESRYVLQSIGVVEDDIIFLGTELAIDDGALEQALSSVWPHLLECLSTHGTPDRIVMPAWEGGHQDHDATHLLGVCLGQRLGIVADCAQVPLYHGYRTGWWFYRVRDPLPANGRIEYVAIPWAERWRSVRLFFCYPSQWKTWLGLAPFAVLQTLFRGRETLQPVSTERIHQPPHPGRPLYEQRGRARWAETNAAHQRFLESANLTLEPGQ